MKKIICTLLLIASSFCLFAEKPVIHEIQAEAGKGTKINIFWSLPDKPDQKIKNLHLYRNTKQITSLKQLSKLEPIAVLPADFTGYTDTVSDFKDYYYAVISELETSGDSVLYDLVLLSINSTINGVHLYMPDETKNHVQQNYTKYYPDGSLRETPLPYIDILQDFMEEPLVSEEAARQTQSFSNNDEKIKPLLKPYLFQEDLVSPENGEDYLLFEILKTTFVQKKYQQAITKLEKLIGTNINESTRNRAIFYLGESHYLSDDFEASVRVFVKVRTVFPELSKQWIDSALDRL